MTLIKFQWPIYSGCSTDMIQIKAITKLHIDDIPFENLQWLHSYSGGDINKHNRLLSFEKPQSTLLTTKYQICLEVITRVPFKGTDIYHTSEFLPLLKADALQKKLKTSTPADIIYIADLKSFLCQKLNDCFFKYSKDNAYSFEYAVVTQYNYVKHPISKESHELRN